MTVLTNVDTKASIVHQITPLENRAQPKLSTVDKFDKCYIANSDKHNYIKIHLNVNEYDLNME